MKHYITACKKAGHPFDEANTYVSKNGARQCRKCAVGYRKKWYYKNKAKKEAK